VPVALNNGYKQKFYRVALRRTKLKTVPKKTIAPAIFITGTIVNQSIYLRTIQYFIKSYVWFLKELNVLMHYQI